MLLFCVAFGLSMDYEVFLLSRIKEEYDLRGDNEEAVAVGLERTGRIVTAAALLLALVYIAFATSGVTIVKVLGLGLALAILVDAFLIRLTLVPAFMRLAGRANWWAPRSVRRLHLRVGIWESEPLPVLDLPGVRRTRTPAVHPVGVAPTEPPPGGHP
jgi:RND superfamily putative drug exporter